QQEQVCAELQTTAETQPNSSRHRNGKIDHSSNSSDQVDEESNILKSLLCCSGIHST
ncbi:Os01g0362800, partial [Oryza sativa Japonica Group]